MPRGRRPKISLKEIYTLGKQIPPPPSDLAEPVLSENSWYVGRTRYARRNEKGEPIETAKEMFWRVAYNIATAERLYGGKESDHLEKARQFYALMASQKFIPNTPTMLNTGKPNQQLSACFVLPVEDNMESILKTMADMALIHKSGGGTGFSFSRLRPYGDIISTSGGTTVGPVSFMQAYNDVTTQIKQGGVRRGANMGILHITHPDILRFAVHKVDEFTLTNFNISVTVTEEFMEQVKRDEKYVTDDFNYDEVIAEIKEAHAIRDVDLKLVRIEAGVKKLYDWCRATHEDEGYELINPRTGKAVDKLNAKKVFDLITRLAWEYGDPGMIYIDRINKSRANPTPQLGQIEATNPCAEQPLLPYDACTLGSINLAKFFKEGSAPWWQSPDEAHNWRDKIDWSGLKQAIHLAVNFLDNVLDMNEYPIPEIFEMTRKIRRIGLGVMGFADLLVQLGVGYNTHLGLEVAESVMKFVQEEADNASCLLAKTRGVFPAFKGSIYDKPGGIRPRNGARTTIAPTGTISMLAGCSSGIEPHFAITFSKNTVEGKRLFETNQYFLRVAKELGFYSDDLLEKIEKNNGSVQGIEEVPEHVQKIFVTARDISPEWHVKMLAAFQKYTDNGVSKTINFPNQATVEDVRLAYWLTYETKCNMITIYRDGSREKQVLETKKTESYYDQLAGKTKDGKSSSMPLVRKEPTPAEAWGMRIRKRADVGYVYTSVFKNAEGKPVEVFVTIGKTGGYIAAAAEVTGRLASRALKYGATLEEIASDLIGITCGTPYGVGPNAILSAFDAVGKSILEIAGSKQLAFIDNDSGSQSADFPVNGEINNKKAQLMLSQPKNDSTGQNSLVNGESMDGNEDSVLAEKKVNANGQSSSGNHLMAINLENTLFGSCPNCGSPLVALEGCMGGTCINPVCGWSKCG